MEEWRVEGIKEEKKRMEWEKRIYEVEEEKREELERRMSGEMN